VIRHLPRPTRSHLLAPALVLLLLLAAFTSGCGGSSKAAGGGGGGTDPASAAPPGSALFLSANVRPQGTAKANIERVGGAILATGDFSAEVQRLLSKSAKGAKDLNFRRDVQPWLGDRLALALPSFTARGDGLMIAATTDDALARTSLQRAIPGAQSATYLGTDYVHSPGGKHAAAVVDHLALFGSEADVKRAIDASKGTSLAETPAYTRAISSLPGDALATGYLDLRSAITSAGAAAGQGATTGALSSVLGKNLTGVGLGAYADADAVRLEVAIPGSGALGGTVTGGDASASLLTAPAGAWLGIGLGNVGKTLSNLLDGIAGGGGITGIGVQAVLGQAEQSLGLDIRKDLLAWMGSAHIFVSGTTRKTVGGALVVHSTDPAATKRAVQQLSTVVPRLMPKASFAPLPASIAGAGFSARIGKKTRAYVVAQGDSFVIAIGARALKQALSPRGRLGDDPGFKAIAGKLGGAKPVLYLDLQQVADLVSALGGKKAQGAVDVLHRFTQLAAGGKAEGDVSRATVVAGVKVR
jgi:hypothetical protein